MIALVILGILLFMAVAGTGAFLYIRSRESAQQCDCNSFLSEHAMARYENEIKTNAELNAVFPASKVNEMSDVVTTFMRGFRAPLCQCFSSLEKLPEGASTQNGMFLDVTNNDFGLNCGKYKVNPLFFPCMLNNLTWGDNFDPIINYAIDQMTDPTTVGSLKTLSRAQQISNEALPPDWLLSDMQEVLRCVYNKIKTDHPTPRDLLMYITDFATNNGRSDEESLSAVETLIQNYINSCVFGKNICVDTSRLKSYLRVLARVEQDNLLSPEVEANLQRMNTVIDKSCNGTFEFPSFCYSPARRDLSSNEAYWKDEELVTDKAGCDAISGAVWVKSRPMSVPIVPTPTPTVGSGPRLSGVWQTAGGDDTITFFDDGTEYIWGAGERPFVMHIKSRNSEGVSVDIYSTTGTKTRSFQYDSTTERITFDIGGQLVKLRSFMYPQSNSELITDIWCDNDNNCGAIVDTGTLMYMGPLVLNVTSRNSSGEVIASDESLSLTVSGGNTITSTSNGMTRSLTRYGLQNRSAAAIVTYSISN